MAAVAFVSWGVWVADCPNPACTNAMALEPEQAGYFCGFPESEEEVPGVCGWEDSVTWPDDVAAIEASLSGLQPAQQNWAPEEGS